MSSQSTTSASARDHSASVRAALLLGLPARWTLVVLGATLLLICAAFSLLLWNARVAERQKASIAASNLSAAITQDIARNIELYDLSIQGVLEGLADPATMASSPAIRNRLLFDRSAAAPFLGSIIVLNEDGNVLLDSASVNPRSFNYTDREFFQTHKARADLGLFISAPYLSRTDREWVINLSRRVTKSDGSFGGVVAGTFRLEYFRRAFSRLKVGPNGSLTLVRTDGTVIMRDPYDPALLGQVKHNGRLFGLLAGAPEGEYEARSVLDGVDRLYHYQRVGSYQLVQLVGLSTDDIYAGWWPKAVAISAMLLAAMAIIVGLMLALRNELMGRIAAEAALVTMAREDALTGLANRRRFDEVLAEEIRRASRHGWPLALLMIDADHFKGYNDALGHVAGDAALVALSGCLQRRTSRSGELAARYGGEEFAVILPNLDDAEAFRLAELIRRDVLELDVPRVANAAQFSVSIGVATKDSHDDTTPTRLIAAADEALYASKSDGRNRSTLARACSVRPELPRLAS